MYKICALVNGPKFMVCCGSSSVTHSQLCEALRTRLELQLITILITREPPAMQWIGSNIDRGHYTAIVISVTSM